MRGPGGRPAEVLAALYAGADDTDWRLPETLQGMFISDPSYSASAGMSAGVGHAGSGRTWAVPRCTRTVA
ncbi:hypothetical protein [Tessaracoccus sp. OH4464_COT-324]|uniref:hypothetical protein n=1 Tax=Tessaracoccus sp. OH4464_COT-324 TaxID=2491059 RepID=UPI000F63D957|nr:hypothetical protein [Tessaracoccus sp. OH4464_COT-324]RRD46103.1 hypothetical protein EII42_08550 [Tessaracoccus sp. OH4464_COT-324]